MPPKRQNNNHKQALSKLVRKKLHNARLTGPPTWYKTSGRHRLPQEIPNSPPYFIKIRVLSDVTATSPLSITPYLIGTLYTTLFTHLSVNRIDAWAQTGDVTVALLPYRQIGSEIAADRQFYGTGTSGASRPYVSVSLAQKDVVAQTITTTSKPICDVKVYDAAGNQIAGTAIVDLWCCFTTASSQLELTRSLIKLSLEDQNPSGSPSFEVLAP